MTGSKKEPMPGHDVSFSWLAVNSMFFKKPEAEARARQLGYKWPRFLGIRDENGMWGTEYWVKEVRLPPANFGGVIMVPVFWVVYSVINRDDAKPDNIPIMIMEAKK